MWYNKQVRNKRNRSKLVTRIVQAVVLLALFFIMRQAVVAEWYAQHLYPFIATVLSYCSSLFPFSLSDVSITLLVVAIPISLLLACFRVVKWRRTLLSLGLTLVGVVIWFYASWGINYFRPDFYARTAIPETSFDSTTFRRFLAGYVDAVNAAYCVVPELDLEQVDRVVENSYENMQMLLKIPYPCGKRRTKKMFYEKWMTRSGISGYFGPFFSEVHVNFYPIAVEIPFTLAHEKAHQFGITSESECNLYAYIVCTASKDSVVRYSGYLGGLGYVLSNTARLFPDDYKAWIARVDNRVLDDYRASVTRWRSGIDKGLSEAQSKVYDAYLKSNNVKSGMKSYSEMMGLLVSWSSFKASEP